jgi:pyruvate carboxylase
MYAAADRLLGHLVKVTPSSKVVGDLALQLVGAGVPVADFAADPGKYDLPDSVVGFLRGELGDPPGGWPEPFRSRALEGRRPAEPPAELSDDDLEGLAKDPRRTLNRLLFAGPTKEFEQHRETYGDTSVLPSKEFLYGLRSGVEHSVDLEPGVRLLIGIEAVSDADDRGMRTVMCTLNGQMRPVAVRDRSVTSDVQPAEKADRSDPDQVAAPFAGVVTLAVSEGDQVEAGVPIGTIEAMKMEAAITAPRAGSVKRVAISAVQQVEGGDLLVVLG